MKNTLNNIIISLLIKQSIYIITIVSAEGVSRQQQPASQGRVTSANRAKQINFDDDNKEPYQASNRQDIGTKYKIT